MFFNIKGRDSLFVLNVSLYIGGGPSIRIRDPLLSDVLIRNVERDL